jgi:hypothetical protein
MRFFHLKIRQSLVTPNSEKTSVFETKALLVFQEKSEKKTTLGADHG